MIRVQSIVPVLAVAMALPVLAADPAPAEKLVAATDPSLPVQPLPQRMPHSGTTENMFRGHSWYTPPPPPPPRPRLVTAPRKPVAPPLPFTLLGSYEQEGTPTTYYLLKGDRVYDVVAGDVIDDTYVVEGEVDGNLEFTYLPLQTSQGIRLGEDK